MELSQKILQSLVKHIIAIIFIAITLNFGLSIFSDGLNFDALSRCVLRSNAQIEFDGAAIELLDNKEVKKDSMSGIAYARSGFFKKNFKLDFVAKTNSKESSILLKSKHFSLDNVEIDSLVDYQNILLSINGQPLSSQDSKITNISLTQGDKLELTFTASNLFPSLIDLQKQHELKIYHVLSVTLIVALAYYLFFYKYVLVFSYHKILKFNNFVGFKNFVLYAVLIILLISSTLAFRFTAVNSNLDRRELAKFPSIFINHTQYSPNKNFFNELNSYLEDRFGLRNMFLKSKLQSDILLKSVVENGNCLWNKDNNWFVSLADTLLEKFDDNFNQRLLDNVNNLDAYFKQKNIKFILAIIPEPYEIYTDENKFASILPKSIVEADTIKLLEEKATCPVIFPYLQLLKAKDQDYVFFKADHHWTDFGSYIGFKMIANVIELDHKTLKTLTWEQLPHTKSNLIRSDFDRKFSIGETAATVGLDSKSHLDTLYTYYDPQFPYLDYKAPDGLESYRKWHNDQGYPLKIYAMGTSFNENLTPFFAANFKDVIYSRLNQGIEAKFKVIKHTKTLVEKFKPDVVVLTLTVPNLKLYTEHNFGMED